MKQKTDLDALVHLNNRAHYVRGRLRNVMKELDRYMTIRSDVHVALECVEQMCFESDQQLERKKISDV